MNVFRTNMKVIINFLVGWKDFAVNFCLKRLLSCHIRNHFVSYSSTAIRLLILLRTA
uniref:Uncharacterized protein n=1 Tax=Octopus bimaculoides TaxID=37653 RepID=A0A0L8IE10_OCTBM